MHAFILLISNPGGESNPAGYIAGAVIALLILGYLIYSLVNPDKF